MAEHCISECISVLSTTRQTRELNRIGALHSSRIAPYCKCATRSCPMLLFEARKRPPERMHNVFSTFRVVLKMAALFLPFRGQGATVTTNCERGRHSCESIPYKYMQGRRNCQSEQEPII